MLAFACPLQAFQLVDGVNQLAMIRGFVAEDLIQAKPKGQPKRIPAPVDI